MEKVVENVNNGKVGPGGLEASMFAGTIIDDLVKTVQVAEANLETAYRMREELQSAPAFMVSRNDVLRTREFVMFGVA